MKKKPPAKTQLKEVTASEFFGGKTAKKGRGQQHQEKSLLTASPASKKKEARDTPAKKRKEPDEDDR